MKVTYGKLFEKTRKSTLWTMIISSIMYALIFSILIADKFTILPDGIFMIVYIGMAIASFVGLLLTLCWNVWFSKVKLIVDNEKIDKQIKIITIISIFLFPLILINAVIYYALTKYIKNYYVGNGKWVSIENKLVVEDTDSRVYLSNGDNSNKKEFKIEDGEMKLKDM